jgi:hypothetical protein
MYDNKTLQNQALSFFLFFLKKGVDMLQLLQYGVYNNNTSVTNKGNQDHDQHKNFDRKIRRRPLFCKHNVFG